MGESPQRHSYILKAECPDTIGIVAQVAGHMRDQGLFIEESAQFGDLDTGRFFMRVRFMTQDGSDLSRGEFRRTFEPIAEPLQMKWQIFDTRLLPRVLILVSKLDHCLNDLLYRYRTGALRMIIPAIVSNHMDLADLAAWHNVPFFHVPVTQENRLSAEERLMEIIEDTQAETIVLARYMQILSNEICEELRGRVINIHHSFLPGFKGARPYHQAHDRGVKLIGATAHYVTSDLDEGPIIEQLVERVDHSRSPDDFAAVGRDVECITLARAMHYHLDHRVFLNGNRTVVFS